MNSFLRADEELSRAADGGALADRESGSTALVALVAGAQLLVANAGDSRRAPAVTSRARHQTASQTVPVHEIV